MTHDALAIVGPTASGKTAVSLRVAERLGGEVVSMDSRQVYRGMDIGTAKVAPAEAGAVPHHGLDLVDPHERYSAGAFARDARRWIREIAARGHVPVLVGGTGFFLRALTQPMFEEPPMDAARRERLKAFLAAQPPDLIRAWLHRLDPATAAALERGGGVQRVQRALEVALLTGRPLSWWHAHAPPEEEPLSPRIFVLELPRAELFARIDRRVDAMLAAGLVEEVRQLAARGYDERAAAMSATGYAEVLAYLRGETSLEDTGEAIKRATRDYARRQVTWFRNQLPGNAIRLEGLQPPEALADEIARIWRQQEDGT